MDYISGTQSQIDIHPIRKKSIWIDWIGWNSTCLFAISAWISPSLGSIFLYIMVAAMLADIRNFWDTARCDPMFWFFLVFLGYIIFTSIYASLLFPDTKSAQWDGVWRYSQLFLFVSMAYWLKSDMNRIKTVLILSLLGLVVGIPISFDWVDWQDIFLQGKRIMSNRWNVITIGFYAATALLGLLLFGSRLLSGSHHNAVKMVRLAVLLFLTAYFTQSVIFTQSRTVWISIILVYPPVMAVQLWYLFKHQSLQISRRWILTSAALVMATFIFILAHNYDSVADRLGVEHDNFKKVIALETEGYTPWGFGVRVLLNIYGFQKWKERPILGWGPGTAFKKYDHAHLHNSYLEILVRFGIVGAALFIAMLGLVLRALSWARAGNKLPLDLMLFLFGTFVLTTLFCAAGYRLDKIDFRTYWIHLAGISYTFYMHRNNPSLGNSSKQ